MKITLTILVAVTMWIHFAPQFIDWKRGIDGGVERCEGRFTMNYKWTWYSLRFYNVWPLCLNDTGDITVSI